MDVLFEGARRGAAPRGGRDLAALAPFDGACTPCAAPRAAPRAVEATMSATVRTPARPYTAPLRAMPRALGETATAVAPTTANISLSINAMNTLHSRVDPGRHAIRGRSACQRPREIGAVAELTARRLPALHDHAGRTPGRIRDPPQQVEGRPNRVCHTLRFGTHRRHSLATRYEVVTIWRESRTDDPG